ncbi:MAG: hypothetical protein KAG53_06095 [Endozoicomonadaceae bacterium]|nr:hypothetical protein [Endozoicomonadaceae bacterium]
MRHVQVLYYEPPYPSITHHVYGFCEHYQLFKTSEYIRGWINYFGIAKGYQRCVDLDHWICRRVRMAYWRQWRKLK